METVVFIVRLGKQKEEALNINFRFTKFHPVNCMSPKYERARRWCFTLNNPGEFRPNLEEGIRYLLYQLEEGANGTPHLQGVAAFTNPMRLGGVRGCWGGNTAHWEPAVAWERAKEYCRKEEGRKGGPWEYGSEGEPGKRSDIIAVCEAIQGGADDRTLALEHPATYFRYPASVDRYRRALAIVPRSRVVQAWWIGGVTGVGKTWHVDRQEQNLWRLAGDFKGWFDGYIGQEAAVFEDVARETLPNVHFLKNLCDKLSIQVPVKGSSTWWYPKRIYFTSNHKFEEVFRDLSQEDMDALRRRIKPFWVWTQQEMQEVAEEIWGDDLLLD